jgi:hypothetical protein
MRFLGFSNPEKEASRLLLKLAANGLQHVFEKWVERFVRSASLVKGGTSKRRPSPHLYKVPTRSNKVNPQTFQMVLVLVNTMNSFGSSVSIVTRLQTEWPGFNSQEGLEFVFLHGV